MDSRQIKTRGVFTGLVLALCIFFLWAGPGLASDDLDDFIGADSCLGCHDGYEEKFDHTLHGRAFSKETSYYENRCEYCHGSGDEHEDDPSEDNIVTFGKDGVSEVDDRNRQCLNCHDSNRGIAMWQGSRHQKEDMACDSCHSAHKGYDPVDRSPESCYTCHLDIKVDSLKQSRHPIREGKVGCGSCHNPHGTMSDHMITDDHTNDLCFKCHADKRGPYMFEHSPVEEDCSICHTPHGSRHKKLLVQRTPSLCQNCHMGSHTSPRAWDQSAGFNGSNPSNLLPI